MPRLPIVVLAGMVLAGAPPVSAQSRVLDLGNGVYEAIGVAVGTGGARTAGVPAGNTFLVAGGPIAVAARARELTASDPLRALYLMDVALAADASHRPALETGLAILKALDAQSTNSNERGWLQSGIRAAAARLK